jgi:hypothetical protein
MRSLKPMIATDDGIRGMDLVWTIPSYDMAIQAAGFGVSTFLIDLENQFEMYSRDSGHLDMGSLVARYREALSGKHLIIRIPKDPAVYLDNTALAFANGADEVLVPGLRNLGQLEKLCISTPVRKSLSMVIETLPILSSINELSIFPLYRHHFGLIDISRELHLVDPLELLSNGFIQDKIACLEEGSLFGFLSVCPFLEHLPIDPRRIIAIMKRLGAGYALLGNSFSESIRLYGLQRALSALRNEISAD